MAYDYLQTFFSVIVGLMKKDTLLFFAIGAIGLFILWVAISLLTCFPNRFYKNAVKFKKKLDEDENFAIENYDMQAKSLSKGFFNGFKQVQKGQNVPSKCITKQAALDNYLENGFFNNEKNIMKTYICIVVFFLILFNFAVVGGQQALTFLALSQCLFVSVLTFALLMIFYYLCTCIKAQLCKLDGEIFYEIITKLDELVLSGNNLSGSNYFSAEVGGVKKAKAQEIFNKSKSDESIEQAKKQQNIALKDDSTEAQNDSDMSEEPQENSLVDLTKFEVDQEDKKASEADNENKIGDELVNINELNGQEPVDAPAETQAEELSSEEKAKKALEDLDFFKKKNIDVSKFNNEVPQSNFSSMPFINVDSEYVIKDDENKALNYHFGATNGSEILGGMMQNVPKTKSSGGSKNNEEAPKENHNEPKENEVVGGSAGDMADGAAVVAEEKTTKQESAPVETQQFDEIQPEEEFNSNSESDNNNISESASVSAQDMAGSSFTPTKPRVEINFNENVKKTHLNKPNLTSTVTANEELDDESGTIANLAGKFKNKKKGLIGGGVEIERNQDTSLKTWASQEPAKVEVLSAENDSNSILNSLKKSTSADFYSADDYEQQMKSQENNYQNYVQQTTAGGQNVADEFSNNAGVDNGYAGEDFSSAEGINPYSQNSSAYDYAGGYAENYQSSANGTNPYYGAYGVAGQPTENMYNQNYYGENYNTQTSGYATYNQNFNNSFGQGGDGSFSQSDIFNDNNQTLPYNEDFFEGQQTDVISPSKPKSAPKVKPVKEGKKTGVAAEKISETEKAKKAKVKAEEKVKPEQKKIAADAKAQPKSAEANSKPVKVAPKKVAQTKIIEEDDMADGKRGRPKKQVFSEEIAIKDDKEFNDALTRAEKLMKKSEEGLSPSQSKRIEKEIKMLMDAMNKYKEEH